MIAVLVSLLLAALVGVALRRRDGSFRHTTARAPAPATDASDDAALAVPGAPATLVQVSADRCSVCPRVATVLADLAARTGVAHVELRAEDHPELLRRHDVRRSPTVLVLDPAGRVLARASGAVTAAQAEAVLAEVLAGTGTSPVKEISDAYAA
jgi:predicted DCC family thiol-disulfide oxidoreductase YuxK